MHYAMIIIKNATRNWIGIFRNENLYLTDFKIPYDGQTKIKKISNAWLTSYIYFAELEGDFTRREYFKLYKVLEVMRCRISKYENAQHKHHVACAQMTSDI